MLIFINIFACTYQPIVIEISMGKKVILSGGSLPCGIENLPKNKGISMKRSLRFLSSHDQKH